MTLRTTMLTGLAAAAFSIIAASAALAGEIKPYSQQTFETAQKAGAPVVVDITASWCPTCKAQKPIIDELAASEALGPVTVFQVDFDDQKDVVRAFGANMQSTLIAFNGTTETARSVGDTKPETIKALFTSSLAKTQ
ncbi:thioredoxin family protein [Rhizobium halophytocola]|uniref:Thiol-disulfide isomerase/thioredoxin n=1 Tax=Rhizobium halophytocola TaxID=735519 RepID=A0ABS4DXI7_9HYPH|nr:thioredoxin family protein [Rhizobium halophytocola]MBP1850397.1 thiol-disulfide isomerase/thioredoxin [Rhizobium halophytocola]